MAARNQERFKDAASLGPTNRDDPRQASGAGSGLDADKLDGQHGAYYLARGNHTGTQAAATISDFSSAADARIAAAVGATVQAFIAAGTTGQYWRGDKTWQTLDKTAVGLGSVDNTADAAKNVLTATKLLTARTIAASGDGTWSVSFDGSGDVTGALTLATVNAGAGTYGTASQVAQIVVDAKGRATSVVNVTITPAAIGAIATSALDTDGTLGANSDAKVASQKATKTYVDNLLAAQDAMIFKGVIDCSTNPNYPAAERGHTYRVSVAGKIGGASGTNVEAGDILLCLTDGTAAGNQATVGANWSIIQTNLDGAVIGPASSTDGGFVRFNGTTGKLIKDSAATVSLTGDVSGALPATNGGTGNAGYAIGDFLYASTTTALSRLAAVATGNVLISGGVNTAPSWGKVALTTHVSGTLPVANGGTNQTSLGNITKTDDTNVTLTLGGTPTGAVITSTSFTLGWTGVLSVLRGGTGASTAAGARSNLAAAGTGDANTFTDRQTFSGGSYSAPAAGTGILYSTSADGLLFGGRGSTNDLYFLNKNGADVIVVPTGTRNIAVGGTVTCASNTTASAANVYQSASATELLRSTSSLRYKKNVEFADPSLVARSLDIPVIWYRSKADADDPTHSFWGVPAEAVAAIDPRLVHFNYLDSDWYEVVVKRARKALYNKAGEEIRPATRAIVERRLRPGAKLVPDGAQYERINLLRTEALKNRVIELEERLAALEAVIVSPQILT